MVEKVSATRPGRATVPISAEAYNRRARAVLSMAGISGECSTRLAGKRDLGAAAYTTVRPASPSSSKDVQQAFAEARADHQDLGPSRLRSKAVVVRWLRPRGTRTTWVKPVS